MNMYKGAGVLFVRMEGGKTEILLGRRSYRPQKDYWSVPGGGMDRKDGNDFLKCAFRESREEILRTNEDLFIKIGTDRILTVCNMHLPFVFRYHVFIVQLSNLNLDFRPNHEFKSVKWFNVKKLPRKTHLGVYFSLLWLKVFCKMSD